MGGTRRRLISLRKGSKGSSKFGDEAGKQLIRQLMRAHG
jgi:hypothetical protein